MKPTELLFRVFSLCGETIMKYATIEEVKDFLVNAKHDAHNYGYAPMCTKAEYEANIARKAV